MRFCLVPLKTASRDVAANLQQIELRLSEIIPHHQPDIVCLPECTLTGYLYEKADFAQFAEPVPGPSTDQISKIAQKYGTFLCFGLLEKDGNDVYNSAVLFDRTGKIVLKHRKNNEKPPFTNGQNVDCVDTEIGKASILICGDLFSDDVKSKLDQRLDFLIVPMSRSFDGISPDVERWTSEEQAVYIEASRSTGTTTVIVNALDVGVEGPAFGGALVVDANGNLAAESLHGTDEVLVWDFN